MKVGIIGLGVIGSACKYGFEKLGHDIKVHDIKFGTTIDEVIDTEINFICVPTPSLGNGSCDTNIVEMVVEELNSRGYNGIVAIKSTVPPTTTLKLQEKTKIKLCFVPEFLRERCAISDFIENHDVLAVGTDDETVFQVVKKCHGNYPKNIVKMRPTEAELLKYYSNVFNAMKITFANEMYEICKKLNIDYSIIKDSFIKRGTTKDIYLDVNENFRGYAGVCLPKDTKALDFFVKSIGLDLKLFEIIDSENNKFKKTVFNGMRLD
jgi:nucleotide sugar dehydrogenase